MQVVETDGTGREGKLKSLLLLLQANRALIVHPAVNGVALFPITVTCYYTIHTA